jgi:pyridoxal phosphate enzyme (YggS family)
VTADPTVAERLAEVRERVRAAAQAAGREPDAVTLVVVTKEVDLDRVRAAIAAGAVELGENRAQDLAVKAEALRADARPGDAPHWHFIGRLQRNKVRAVAEHVALWESIDRAELAVEIGRRAPGAKVLVQVNVTGETQKGGCTPADVHEMVDACRANGCAVEGLMTVPPASGDPRPVFAQVRKMTDDLGLRVCSMGMSGDYEIAIGEGATMVRVGSAIFGPRPGPGDARR